MTEPTFDEQGRLRLSVYFLAIDGFTLSISVPATADGREMAEAWLAKWNRLLTPQMLPSTNYQLRVSHPHDGP